VLDFLVTLTKMQTMKIVVAHQQPSLASRQTVANIIQQAGKTDGR